MEEIEKMTSEEEMEAEVRHQVTALDRLQMVSKLPEIKFTSRR